MSRGSGSGVATPVIAGSPSAGPNFLTRRNRRAQAILFIAGLLLICGAVAFIGIVPTRHWVQDDFFLLANGWAVACGLRPHLDFYSPWGPVTFLVTALGLLVSHDSPNAIGYGNAILGLLLGLWSYWLGRGRLHGVTRILFAFFVVLLATAPYALGTWPMLSTHAMLYNRYGYALLALVLLECMQRAQRHEHDVSEFLGGASTGAALALALFLKANFFVVALPILAASFLLRRPDRKTFGGVVAGFGIITFVLLAYLRFDVARMFHDLRIAAGARSHAMAISIERVSWTEKLPGQVPMLAILLLLVLGDYLPKRQGKDWLQQHQVMIWALLVFAVDLVLLSSNMQATGMPTLAAFGIIVADQVLAERRVAAPEEARVARSRIAVALVLCGVLALPQVVMDLAGLTHGVLEKAHPTAAIHYVRFTAPRLSDIILYDDPPYENGSKYTASVNDGMALILRNCAPTDRVLTMDMANPFPYALGWRPPRGGMAAMAYNYMFTDELRPTEAEYFGDATVVLVPKQPASDQRYYAGFYRIYSPFLLEHYKLADESEWWWLYRLK